MMKVKRNDRIPTGSGIDDAVSDGVIRKSP